MAARASAAVAKICTPNDPCHVSLVVVVEFVWTLGRFYGYGRSDVADAVAALLQTSDLRVQGADAVARACSAFRDGGPGFADHLILELNRREGCSATLTLDRRIAATADAEPI